MWRSLPDCREDSFPTLICIIQKPSASAAPLIVTTVPGLPSALLLIENLTSQMPQAAVLAIRITQEDFHGATLGWEGMKNKASISFASSVESGFWLSLAPVAQDAAF